MAYSEESLPLLEPSFSVPAKIAPFFVSVRLIQEGDCRLDASFHSDEVVAARRILEESGYQLRLLGDPTVVRDIFYMPRSKRIYTTDPTQGWPFLGAQEVFMFRPQPRRWIAREHAPAKAKQHFVQEGWILVTRSGSVGRVMVTGNRLEPFFVTDDILRIIPEQAPGYLYAYLSTWIGQSLMVKEQYGGTIDHLEPAHLRSLPVPWLPENQRRDIHRHIMKAFLLREEANVLLDEANNKLHEQLDVPHFRPSSAPYIEKSTKPKAFSISSRELEGRFDASYHVPISKEAVEQLRTGKYPVTHIKYMVDKGSVIVAPRFARIYVEPEFGVPLLQSSHIPLIRPYGLKYISASATRNIDKWIIKPGWVLVTCSGTIGRIAISTSRQDGWAASQHILRIVPKPARSHPGFLAAFLMCSYGRYQLTAKIYGGVVDELTAEDTEEVVIPEVPFDDQKEIGDLVVRAFEKRDEAAEIEDAVIDDLESLLTNTSLKLKPSLPRRQSYARQRSSNSSLKEAMTIEPVIHEGLSVAEDESEYHAD